MVTRGEREREEEERVRGAQKSREREKEREGREGCGVAALCSLVAVGFVWVRAIWWIYRQCVC